MRDQTKSLQRLLPWLALALLFFLQFIVPDYHHTNLARIMVLGVFAVAYNMAFGYCGLLSLGHAMFFAAGLYAAGLSVEYWNFPMPAAFVLGALAGLALAFVVGLIALRTSGVSFMIVTLMFAQAAYLTILYFNEFTRGDEGFVLAQEIRRFSFAGVTFDLSDPDVRYNLAWGIFTITLLFSVALLRSPVGRVLIAIRENQPRAEMLGYNAFLYRLLALSLSGFFAGLAGAAYALLFAYIGATFASTQYSIYALLWVLLGGAGTVLGPLVGTALMFYLVDFASEITSSYLIFVGLVLVALVLLCPKGLVGSIAASWSRRRRDAQGKTGGPPS